MLLKLVEIEDAGSLFVYFKKNIDDLTAPFPLSSNEIRKGTWSTKNFVKARIQEFKNQTGIFWVLYNFNENRIIGTFASFKFDTRVPRCEMSYSVDKNYRNNGIAKYSIQLIEKYLMNQCAFEKIIARVDIANIASNKLMQNLQYRLEGTHFKDFRDGNNNLIDVNYYGKIKINSNEMV